MKISIGSTIEVSKAKDKTFEILIEQFEFKNPDYYRAKALMDNGAVGRTELPEKMIPCYEILDNDTLSIGINGLEKIKKFGRACGELVHVKDNRSKGHRIDIRLDFSKDVKYLEPYQNRIIKATEKYENLVASGSTGSGKTLTGIGFIAKKKMSALILVDKRDLLVQWIDDLNEHALGDFTIGQFGDGKKTWGDVTVATVQSLKNLSKEKQEEVKNMFGILIIDEVHKASAPTFIIGCTMFATYYRLGLSATPKRKDKKEFLFKMYIGDIMIEVEDEEVIEAGRIVRVKHQFVDTGYSLDYDSIGRDITLFPVECLSDDDRNDVIIYELEKDISLGFIPIVFSNRVVHCNQLFGMLKNRGWNVMLFTGKVDKKIRDEMKKKAKRGDVDIIVANPQIMDTGINIPPLSSAHVTFFTSNEVMLKQIPGRVRRNDGLKQFAKLVYYRDNVFVVEKNKKTGQNVQLMAPTFKRAYSIVRRLFKKWNFEEWDGSSPILNWERDYK